MVRVTSLALIFGHNICAHIMLLFELVWKYGTPQFQGEYRWKSPFWVYWYFQRKTKKQNKPTKYPQNLDNILEMYKCFGNTSFSNKPTKYVQHCSTGRLSPAQQNHQLGSLKKKKLALVYSHFGGEKMLPFRTTHPYTFRQFDPAIEHRLIHFPQAYWVCSGKKAPQLGSLVL